MFRGASSAGAITISGLTITGGGGTADGTGGTVGDGGAIATDNPFSSLTLEDVIVSDSTTSGGRGGGIAATGRLFVTDSEIVGNEATSGLGGGISSLHELTVTGSSVSDNAADTGRGGGINHESARGDLTLTDSFISGNTAVYGAGVNVSDGNKYTVTTSISDTTIEGNEAADDGAGLRLSSLDKGDIVVVSRSTISGNAAPAGFGGGMLVDYESQGAIDLVNSTVSGNEAGSGAGVSLGTDEDRRPVGEDGSVELSNSTVAENKATTAGGGIYLAGYTGAEPVETGPTIALTSTVVGDNVAGGAPEDLDRDDAAISGGADLSYSLVEAPGDATITQSPEGSSILGTDPQLGALGDNGGLTETHLPALTSPLIDKGTAPARLGTDQRDAPRTDDGDVENPAGGDGTDIGSVEVDVPPKSAPPTQTQTTTTTNTVTVQSPPPPPGPERITGRVDPLRMTRKLTPSRDKKMPYRFRVTGEVVPPAGLTKAEACTDIGFVSVQVKRGKKTISTRRVRLKPTCTYSSTVTFRDRKRIRTAKRLKFTARFLGNRFLEPITPSSIKARLG